MKVGVLALQGAVSEHLDALASLDIEGRQVRSPEDLEGLDGLIVPGGESTTLEKLVRRFGIDRALERKVAEGLALWGTCAGMILLAQRITNGMAGQTGLGLLPIEVERNAFGRQLESCEVDLESPCLGPPAFPAVFIRAPVARELLDPSIEELAVLEGRTVALRWGYHLATSFHPELTGDLRWHRYFQSLILARTALLV